MKKRQELLTDEQWELPEPLFPEAKRRRDGRGRPWASNRACFEGILWILQTGAAGRFLPDHFPSPSTCRRRLQRWEEKGIWLEAWRRFLGALDSEGLLRWDERFLDGRFAPAKKGASAVGKTKRGKGTKWMVLVDGEGVPPGVRLDGRKLRRYKRRWIVERTNAWLGQFRRLLVRHEHLLSTCRAFFCIACLWITMRRYL